MPTVNSIKVDKELYERVKTLADKRGQSISGVSTLLLEEGISSATELGKAKANPGSNALAARLAELETTVANFEAEKTRVSSNGRLAGRVADLEASVEDLEAEVTGENSKKRLVGPGGKELPPGYKGLTIKAPGITEDADDERYSCGHCHAVLDGKVAECPVCHSDLTWSNEEENDEEESDEEGSGGKWIPLALGGLALLAILRGGLTSGSASTNTRGTI